MRQVRGCAVSRRARSSNGGSGGDDSLNGHRLLAEKESTAMVDRDKVLSVLRARFPAASRHQVAGGANAIVGLGDEWEEVAWDDPEVACAGPIPAGERRGLADEIRQGMACHLFRKRWPAVRT